MSRRNGLTNHTLAELQAGTGIDAQINDEVRVPDLGSAPGRIFFCVGGNTVPDDGQFTVVEGTEANQWRAKEEVSSVIGSGVSVPFSALFDNSEEDVNVAIPGVLSGLAYVMSPTAVLPDGVDLELIEGNADGSLNFRINNNSGAQLVAGNFTVNVYLV